MKIDIRIWCDEDIQQLQSIANNFEVSKYLRNVFPYPYTNEDAQNFIAFANSAEDQFLRAIIVDGLVAGGCSLELQQDVNCYNAELGYWLGKSFWHQGIASKVVHQVCEYGFQNTQAVRIYAEVFADNLASCRVLEKNGFRQEGRLHKSVYKHGKFMDSLLYARLK